MGLWRTRRCGSCFGVGCTSGADGQRRRHSSRGSRVRPVAMVVRLVIVRSSFRSSNSSKPGALAGPQLSDGHRASPGLPEGAWLHETLKAVKGLQASAACGPTEILAGESCSRQQGCRGIKQGNVCWRHFSLLMSSLTSACEIPKDAGLQAS